MRDSLHIEIYVSREPGSLSVSSYSDFTTDTLDTAIAEAEAFVAHCRAMQADIAEHGLGEAPVPTQAQKDAARAVVEAWDAVVGPADDMFASSPLMRCLR
jgi:hypothetical protein